MAKFSSKTKHVFLYKAACGLILICFTVFVCGQAIHGVSATTILLKSSLLLVAIGLSMHLVLKLWHSWEEIKEGSNTKESHKE